MAYRPYDTWETAADPASELASLRERLAAWSIDFSIYILAVILTPIATLLLVGEGIELRLLPLALVSSPIIWLLLIVLLLVVFIVQTVFLAMRGQTIGKMIVKIRVVDDQTGTGARKARLVLLRIIASWIIVSWIILNQIILVSVGLYWDYIVLLLGIGLVCAYWLVGSLFIFRADRRTIQDLIAGTRVDKVTD